MEKALLKEMFDSLLHIGNKTSFWNPKMKPYIYGSVNGVHVINLLKTAKKLEEVKTELKELVGSGKKILIIATKVQSKDAFKKLAEETGSYYVCEKWVPGLLTNFKTIKKRIGSYLKLLSDSQSGAFNVLTKKERANKMLELEKLDKAYSGLKEMKKLPDAILVSDGIYEKQALKEAKILNIRSYAILNTNGDIDLAHNIIPANTNSTKSFEFLAKELRSALLKVSPAQKAKIRKIEEKESNPLEETKKTSLKRGKEEVKKEELREESERETKVSEKKVKKQETKEETSA